jgi:hypothetical protein
VIEAKRFAFVEALRGATRDWRRTIKVKTLCADIPGAQRFHQEPSAELQACIISAESSHRESGRLLWCLCDACPFSALLCCRLASSLCFPGRLLSARWEMLRVTTQEPLRAEFP